MRSTRTVLAGIICSVAAAVALAAGSAGEAAASGLPVSSTARDTLQDEVPWTGPNPEVPWTGPLPHVVDAVVDVVVGTVVDLVDGGEVPWT
ncbi:hypothetical protein AB0P15_21855 [Streptomyces sp. NPDC087917]|uniref:hypothetical protein n=1 Tax=unclassified Streptomyces TaxID=2593676 RepID=UPI00342AF558